MNNSKIKEESYLREFSDEMLKKYGLSTADKETITSLVEKSIKKHLYTDTNDFQHDLKHIEKVLAYVVMIVNKISNPNINKSLLLTAALYHDIGKTIGASNKSHGQVGALEFTKLMQGMMSSKDIETVSMLINQHALEEDKIDFASKDYTLEEQEQIQLMSDILKDADALDRNRLNYPAPFGNCDINKLRTEAAKEILPLTNDFYHDYYKTIIEVREKRNGIKILDNYAKLEELFNNYQSGKKTMLHASLDPSIDILRPRRSTQKGSYVYAGVDPTDCMKMATFRLSFLFSGYKENGVHIINETFPNTVDEVLEGKFITFYILPNELFHEYVGNVTASPNREWVATSNVVPIRQISFEAKDLVKYLINTNRLSINHNNSKEVMMAAFVRMFRTYIWGIAEINENPKIFDQKWQQIQAIVKYYEKYCPNIMKKMQIIKQSIDNDIKVCIADFAEKNGRTPDLSNENDVLQPVQSHFLGTFFARKSDGRIDWYHLNEKYIKEILTKYGYSEEYGDTKEENLFSNNMNDRQESQKHFATIKPEAENIYQKMLAAKEQLNLDSGVTKAKPMSRVLTKKENTEQNNNDSNSGFISTLLLSLGVCFISGVVSVLSYLFISRG